MKQKYQKMQESLLPAQKKQEEIWKKIVAESDKNRKQKRGGIKTGLIGSVAAALLICGLFIPQTGLADHIREVIQSAFVKGSDNITEDVQNDLYSDQDGHVKMQVSEMLSDGSCVYLGIRYRALDQEGRDFLFDKKWGSGKAVATSNDWIFSFLNTQEFIAAHDQGWTSGIEEIEEMRTDDERYFVYVHYEDSDDFSFDGEEIPFHYAMPEAKAGGEFKEGKIAIKPNLDKFLYRLEKKDSVAGEGQAMYLIVSKLSYQLLMPGADSLQGMAGADEGLVKIVFTTKDGLERKDEAQPIRLRDSSTMVKLIEDAENKGEYQMINGRFYEDNHEKLIASPNALLDYPEQIAALEIGGEQYNLIRED